METEGWTLLQCGGSSELECLIRTHLHCSLSLTFSSSIFFKEYFPLTKTRINYVERHKSQRPGWDKLFLNFWEQMLSPNSINNPRLRALHFHNNWAAWPGRNLRTIWKVLGCQTAGQEHRLMVKAGESRSVKWRWRSSSSAVVGMSWFLWRPLPGGPTLLTSVSSQPPQSQYSSSAGGEGGGRGIHNLSFTRTSLIKHKTYLNF